MTPLATVKHSALQLTTNEYQLELQTMNKSDKIINLALIIDGVLPKHRMHAVIGNIETFEIFHPYQTNWNSNQLVPFDIQFNQLPGKNVNRALHHCYE